MQKMGGLDYLGYVGKLVEKQPLILSSLDGLKYV